jgi:hypothetical protein
MNRDLHWLRGEALPESMRQRQHRATGARCSALEHHRIGASQEVKDIVTFVDDDNGFIEWCLTNGDGYALNCKRSKTGEVRRVDKLHRATKDGVLCRHFRNRNGPDGYEMNLTTTGYCKVCSTDLRSLERYANSLNPDWAECRSCQ